MANTGMASATIAELREFASFSPCEQRFIKRSLDVGLGRQDAFRLWARNGAESAAIRSQYVMYQDLKSLRHDMPDRESIDDGTGPAPGLDQLEGFMGKLIRLTAFDLGQERISGFAAYRFLYERLLGPQARPWLPSAFCAAAALPQIRPERRKRLLQSLSEAAATAPGWSTRAPAFYPEWVDQEAA